MHCGDDVYPLYLTPFYKPHSPKYGDSTLGVKANQSAPECIGSKADYLKAELSAEWMRLWQYERGIRDTVLWNTSQPQFTKRFEFKFKLRTLLSCENSLRDTVLWNTSQIKFTTRDCKKVLAIATIVGFQREENSAIKSSSVLKRGLKR